MKIAISAESTVDLTKELLEEFRITTVPFTVLLGDRAGLDGEITSKEIIDYVTKNKIFPRLPPSTRRSTTSILKIF